MWVVIRGLATLLLLLFLLLLEKLILHVDMGACKLCQSAQIFELHSSQTARFFIQYQQSAEDRPITTGQLYSGIKAKAAIISGIVRDCVV